MRIVYHHRTRAEDAQGIHIKELISAFRAEGHHVTLVAPLARRTDKPVDDTSAQRDGSAVLSMQLPPWLYECIALAYNVPALLLLAYAVWRSKCDFIYERYSLFAVSGCLLAKLFRRPLILEVNAPLSLEMKQHGGLTFERLARWAEAWVIKNATRTVVVTEAMREIFVQQGIDRGRFVIMPNGVDRGQFHPAVNDQPVRERWSLGDSFVVGFVGWIRTWHGVDYLIQAAARCSTAIPHLKILIVGDGPAIPDLKELTRALKLDSQVVFTGAVASNAIPEHLAAMDVAVQPDVTDYASPIKLFEYLAMGKAVIAPDRPNILEIVEDGRTALIYQTGNVEQLANCLQRLHGDDPLRQRLAANAGALIEQRGYYWLANARRVVDLVAPSHAA